MWTEGPAACRRVGVLQGHKSLWFPAAPYLWWEADKPSLTVINLDLSLLRGIFLTYLPVILLHLPESEVYEKVCVWGGVS